MIVKKIFVYTMCVLGITLFISPHAQAADRYVPSSYSTIQAAIKASSNGDTVYVSPGTYRECITIDNKYVSIRATNADPNATLITGCVGRTNIMIQNVPYRAGVSRVSVTGFRIANGSSPEGQGGAITVANSADPIIDGNYFVANHGNVDGGAILVFNNSNPVIKNNLFDSNSAARLGGAIMIVKLSGPTIYNNTFTNNIASGGSIPGGGPSGGAIYLENNPADGSSRVKSVISNNVISHNNADHAGGGIMLRVGVDVIIENNSIDHNVAAFGGGIHIETEGSYPTVRNNTISNNDARKRVAYNGSGYGGGISVYNTSYPKITHNTISNNIADEGGAGLALAENSSSTIDANFITGNSVANASTSNQLFGGGIYLANARLNAINNVISGNTAGVGGGFASLDNAIYSLYNNTIVNNNAVSQVNTASGGGVYVGDSSGTSANFVNNIIAFNSNYQIFEGAQRGFFTNNLVTNSGKGLYFNWSSGGISNPTTLDASSKVNASGTLSNDPMFVNNTTDFNLQAASPAKDSGYQAPSVTSDIRNAIRPLDAGYDRGSYEYTTSTVFKSPVYRFWSSENKGHFYTSSESEKNSMIASYPVQGWQYEGENYSAYTTQVSGSTPVYRFWSSENKGHFYTVNSAERDYVINNYSDSQWLYEGIAYYVYDINSPSGNPVYRFWSSTFQHHFYTADAGEKDFVISTMSQTWQYEGVGFKVP